MVNRRPKLELPFGDRQDRRTASTAASPAEAAAIVAALERFMRDTSPPTATPGKAVDPWLRAAMLEGVAREGQSDEPDPWINA